MAGQQHQAELPPVLDTQVPLPSQEEWRIAAFVPSETRRIDAHRLSSEGSHRVTASMKFQGVGGRVRFVLFSFFNFFFNLYTT